VRLFQIKTRKNWGVPEEMKCADLIGVICGNWDEWEKWKLTIMEKWTRNNRKDERQLARCTPSTNLLVPS
jgi:hypothetical protein